MTLGATPGLTPGVVVFALAADPSDQALGFVLDDDSLDHRLDHVAISLRQLRYHLELQVTQTRAPIA